MKLNGINGYVSMWDYVLEDDGQLFVRYADGNEDVCEIILVYPKGELFDVGYCKVNLDGNYEWDIVKENTGVNLEDNFESAVGLLWTFGFDYFKGTYFEKDVDKESVITILKINEIIG